MQHYRKELWFEAPTRRAFINITSQVEECLRESGIVNGFVLCNSMQMYLNDLGSSCVVE